MHALHFPTAERSKNLQALRAVAALMVVWAHLLAIFNKLGIPALGGNGVDLFFVISGFVMVHTTRVHPPTSMEFIKNRIARIVPIYWLMTAFVYLVAVFAHSWIQATSADPLQLVKSLLFIPFEKSNGLVQPVLFLGWTLNYEMFFYALFSLGLVWRNYSRGLASIFIALGALVLSGQVFHPSGVIAAFYTNSRIIEFALGMIVAILVSRAPEQPLISQALLATFSICSLILVFAAPKIWPDLSLLLSAGVPSAVLVAAVVLLERWGWGTRSRTLLAIGDASYALYLCHPYVVIPIAKFGLSLHPGLALSIFLICATVAISACTALLLHWRIERPLSKWARRLLSAKRLTPQPA